uniref:Uncharacterized protein n=1 Tax=Rhodnius prolixus TaxID=13249 RepID=T1IAN3_RHOPR
MVVGWTLLLTIDFQRPKMNLFIYIHQLKTNSGVLYLKKLMPRSMAHMEHLMLAIMWNRWKTLPAVFVKSLV